VIKRIETLPHSGDTVEGMLNALDATPAGRHKCKPQTKGGRGAADWVVTHRRKYACRVCEQAAARCPAPELRGGLPTEAMLAMSWLPNTPGIWLSLAELKCCSPKGIDIKRDVASWAGYTAA
jgi:hypothetical protein